MTDHYIFSCLFRDTVNKVNTVLDEIGWASAKAQGLLKPITSGGKLKDSEHILYLLIDPGSPK